MKKSADGFSLIELIIAVAILIILTGLLAPQFMKQMEKSRRAVCMNGMDTIGEEFTIGMIDAGALPDTGTARDVLDKVITRHGGKVEGKETEQSVVYVYGGLCKSSGKYRCTFINNLTALRVECSEHGDWELDIVTLKNLLDTIDLTPYKIPYTKVSQYFSGGRNTLDSEGISTDDRYGSYKSFAKVIGLELTKNGINVSNKSWVLYRNSRGGYELYLTPGKVYTKDKGAVVECTKYDVSKGESGIIRGTIKIDTKAVKGESYAILLRDSFEEN